MMVYMFSIGYVTMVLQCVTNDLVMLYGCLLVDDEIHVHSRVRMHDVVMMYE